MMNCLHIEINCNRIWAFWVNVLNETLTKVLLNIFAYKLLRICIKEFNVHTSSICLTAPDWPTQTPQHICIFLIHFTQLRVRSWCKYCFTCPYLMLGLFSCSNESNGMNRGLHLLSMSHSIPRHLFYMCSWTRCACIQGKLSFLKLSRISDYSQHSLVSPGDFLSLIDTTWLTDPQLLTF